MSPAQRSAMKQSARQWEKLPGASKQQIRARFQQYAKMSPEQKQKLIQRMNKFQALPDHEREALRLRWQQQIQQRTVNNEPLPGKKNNSVTATSKNSVEDNCMNENCMDENVKAEAQTKSTGGSRLENTNRMRNNRLDTQRINRPMRGTR
jgi:superfamily II helicase